MLLHVCGRRPQTTAASMVGKETQYPESGWTSSCRYGHRKPEEVPSLALCAVRSFPLAFWGPWDIAIVSIPKTGRQAQRLSNGFKVTWVVNYRVRLLRKLKGGQGLFVWKQYYYSFSFFKFALIFFYLIGGRGSCRCVCLCTMPCKRVVGYRFVGTYVRTMPDM